jgi:cyclic pyranopterin phosphate synthase
MVEITHKNTSLRVAIAEAIVKVSNELTMDAILNKKVPKGDVFEMAKTAGLFAVKNTSSIIPDCHPLPVEYTKVSYETEGLEIKIFVEVKTIYRTGVEVEAMHGASVVALTMYDMLKPIDKGIEIKNIRLVEKKGGKSDFKNKIPAELKIAVVVCSDTISAGLKEDRAGLAIIEKFKSFGLDVKDYIVVADEVEDIRDVFDRFVGANYDLLIYTGGTGLSVRDVTPEAIIPLLDREIPGIAEAMRTYGQERTALSMLSRSFAGVAGKTLILALPGSTKGAVESMEAVFPGVFHLYGIFKGARHDS